MRKVIVDTSVVSYLFKGHSLALQYGEYLRDKTPGLSFMSMAELYRWPLERSLGERRLRSLLDHLRHYAVFSPDEEMTWEWARIMSRKGRPISPTDAWIAATAVRYRAPLVTHNPRHFRYVEGLDIVTVAAG